MSRQNSAKEKSQNPDLRSRGCRHFEPLTTIWELTLASSLKSLIATFRVTKNNRFPAQFSKGPAQERAIAESIVLQASKMTLFKREISMLNANNLLEGFIWSRM
jgi:hypothetical protein